MNGKKVGKYTVVRQLGKGAMGCVWEAVDSDTGEPVALKVMRLPEGISAGSRRVLIERFRREAEVLKRIDHPGVVKVYAAGETEGRPYIAMELLSGRTLREELDLGGPLPMDQVERIVVQICQALHAAHRHGVVHRDIKPDNVMLLGGRDQIKLTDFGVAKSLEDSTLTATGSTLGTPAYMSPEQVQGRELDGRSDIFSTGVILYELATRRRPFRGDNLTEVTYRIVTEDPLLNVRLPRYLTDIIAKALKKDPDDRYQSAMDMADDLAAHRSPFAVARTQPGTPAAPPAETSPSDPAPSPTRVSLEDDEVLKELSRRVDEPEESAGLGADLAVMFMGIVTGALLGVLVASAAGALSSGQQENWVVLVRSMKVGIHVTCFLAGLVTPRVLATRGYEPDWTGKVLGIVGFSVALSASALSVLEIPLSQFGPLTATAAAVGLAGVFVGSGFAWI